MSLDLRGARLGCVVCMRLGLCVYLVVRLVAALVLWFRGCVGVVGLGVWWWVCVGCGVFGGWW